MIVLLCLMFVFLTHFETHPSINFLDNCNRLIQLLDQFLFQEHLGGISSSFVQIPSPLEVWQPARDPKLRYYNFKEFPLWNPNTRVKTYEHFTLKPVMMVFRRNFQENFNAVVYLLHTMSLINKWFIHLLG